MKKFYSVLFALLVLIFPLVSCAGISGGGGGGQSSAQVEAQIDARIYGTPTDAFIWCAKNDNGVWKWETCGVKMTVSGTPAQYEWTIWNSATEVKGVAVTASKPVCTDANGSPTACTDAMMLAPTTTVGSGASTRTTASNSEYIICTSTCTVTPKVPVAGAQFCVRNAPGSATVITLAAIADVYYEKQDRSGWAAAANKTMTSGGVATDQICMVGYDATHYAILSATGTWTNTP